MGVLRSIEHRIESLVEGVFGRVFRSHVQPVELARKLAKEMDDNKTVSVSRVYAPNEYILYLAPKDRAQFADYEPALVTELADYLSEHARREGYAMLTMPRIVVKEDADLSVGEFGIATRMAPARQTVPQPTPTSEPDFEPIGPEPPRVQSPPPPPPVAEPSPPPPVAEPPQPSPGPEATQVFPPPAPPSETAPAATLTLGGTPHELTGPAVVLGRSRDCDLTINDPNISRRHAEVRREGGGFWIIDLESTNGVVVNGERIERRQLEPGDTILLGSTELTFERAD